jgi:hypothetical protein
VKTFQTAVEIMKKFVILLLLLLPSGAWATCNPTNAPAGSVGCDPVLTSPQSTDTLLLWRPSLFPEALNQITFANLMAGYLPLTGGTVTGSTTFSAGLVGVLAGAVINIVSNTYTSAGTIAITDTFALINNSYAVAMTLAAGTVDGHPIIINNYGAGTATVTLNIQGSVTPVVLPSGSVLNVSWNVALATYLLTS